MSGLVPSGLVVAVVVIDPVRDMINSVGMVQSMTTTHNSTNGYCGPAETGW